MKWPDDVISPDYVQMQRQLHARPNGYGGKGAKWAGTVLWLADQVRAASVLDYGCGQGSLARALAGSRVVCREYDPAIAGKDGRPAFADLVVCTDVLEHIEPARLSAVLAHLASLARRAIFLVVNLRPANKTLADGRNAHLIQESPTWWAARVTDAGMRLLDLPGMPLAASLNAEKQAKCWVAVVAPC